MQKMLWVLTLIFANALAAVAGESPRNPATNPEAATPPVGNASTGVDASGMPGRSHRGPLPPADDQLVTLATELRQHVEQLAARIGERNLLRHPRELAQTANYVEAEWARAGYKPQRQEYDVSGARCCNVEAEIVGNSRPNEIVILGAHYDSALGTPGANDNATGVAAVLALARRFAHRPLARTLRFVAFANEETPYFQTDKMGSRVYARRCRERGERVSAMLSLETMGYFSETPDSQKYPFPFSLLYPSTGNFIGFVGNTNSGELVRQVVAAFRQGEPFPSEGGALPDLVEGAGFSDHWSFWQEGCPALMVTDTAMFRYPHYHEREDTVDKVDFQRLARVVRGLDIVLAALVTGDAEATGKSTQKSAGP